MKISELIKQLEEHKENYGDVEVFFDEGSDSPPPFDNRKVYPIGVVGFETQIDKEGNPPVERVILA